MESRKLVKTKDPGIFKRGSRYVVVYRDPEGHQRTKSAGTLAEARSIKAGVRTDISRGEYVPQTRVTLRDYFESWVTTYTGRTTRGIRPDTLNDYAASMRLYVLPVLGRRRLADITPQGQRTRCAWPSRRLRRSSRPPSRMGLSGATPPANVRIAQPKTVAEDGIDAAVKSLTEEQLQPVLAEIPADWRLFSAFLGQTGLRISEAPSRSCL
jgi:integrase